MVVVLLVAYERRRYTTAQQIEKLAVEKYRKNGKGITFNDLLHSGLASNKKQSQITLKHYRNKAILFTISVHKPQQYYPTSIKSEILKAKMTKNIPIGVTEVAYSHEYSNTNLGQTNNNNSSSNGSNNSIFSSLEPAIIQSLEGYVLPLLAIK
jgi:hypothetical protein